MAAPSRASQQADDSRPDGGSPREHGPIITRSRSDAYDIEDYIDLVVENRTGAQLYYFSYADCGSEDYTGVIASDEYVSSGNDVTAYDLDPGCYDLYVEDEFGCWAENSTDGNIEGGIAFTWTVVEADLTCL